MTVSALPNYVTFQGTGTTGPFSFSMTFDSNSEIVVTTQPTGGPSMLVSPALYTLTGAGSLYGGSVILNTPLAISSTITVTRVLPLAQNTSIPEGGQFFSTVIEKTFDRLVKMIQQTQGQFPTAEPFITGKNASDYGPDLSYAVTAIGSGSVTVWITSPITVNNSLTSPSNISIICLNTGSLIIAPDQTLTINGPSRDISTSGGGNVDIYGKADGDIRLRHNGTTVFGYNCGITPEPDIFKDNIAPGTTDMTAALQNAYNAASALWMPGVDIAEQRIPTIKFRATSYAISSVIFSKSVKLQGQGVSEFSAGTSLLSTGTGSSSMISVLPIATGCTFQMQDISVRGTGTGTGNLVTTHNNPAGVNSIRISNVVFGTPDGLGLQITGSDDVIIDKVLFDVSAAHAMFLDSVSNVQIIAPKFFSVNLKAITLKDVENITIIAPQAYSSSGSTFCNQFIDGSEAGGTFIKNLKVIGGNFSNYNILANIANSKGVVFIGNTLTRAAANASETMSIVRFTGTMDGMQFIGNSIESGLYSYTHKFLDTSGATTTTIYTVANNAFRNLSSSAGYALGTSVYGSYNNNSFDGFNESYVSERLVTTGNTMTPGTLAAGASYTQNLIQVGAYQGHNVIVAPLNTTPIAPVGIYVEAYVSATSTITVRYSNLTSGSITIPAHDISVLIAN